MVLLQGTQLKTLKQHKQWISALMKVLFFFINVDNDFLLGAVCEAANDGVKAFNIHHLDEISSIQISSQFWSF